MFSIPITIYALCIMDGEAIKKFTEYGSEAELIKGYDNLKGGEKVVALAWTDTIDDSKLIWILSENVLLKDDDPMELLMNIYGQIFDYGDEFMAEYE